VDSSKAKYNNDQNIEHKILILKTKYAVEYHDNYGGGLLGFLSTVATRYNVMDYADPKILFHTRKTHHQKMLFVRNQLVGSKYRDKAYDLYDNLKESSSFDQYTQ
jgi:hypothetical protein